MLILYYRKDIFEEMPLGADHVGRVLRSQQGDHRRDGAEVYGAGFMRVRGLLHYFYQERARNEGCVFFDAESMAATINGPGCVTALAGMVKDNTTMPPGVEQWGAIESLAAFNAGQIAMTQWWPPVGRWSAGYGTDDIAMQWVPPSVVAGKVGYALPPAAIRSSPRVLDGVSADSNNKTRPTSTSSGINSIDISLQRVQLPYTLRDPFRKSHFESSEYQSLWPDAKEYLDALASGRVSGLLDMSIINTFAYEDALAIGLQATMGGADPQEELDGVAEAWDALTERVGVDNQRAAYCSGPRSRRPIRATDPGSPRGRAPRAPSSSPAASLPPLVGVAAHGV